MAVRSFVWMGVRTREFDAMVRLYRDVFEMPVLRQDDHAAWFGLADGNELHVYALSDEDHVFFGSGPVIGLLVDDFEQVRSRMIAAGIEFIGEPQREAGSVWNHYRAPDGNVYEIMERWSREDVTRR